MSDSPVSFDNSRLDNPIWHSLSSSHACFSLGDDLAKRFDPEIGPLAGMRDQTPEAYRVLAALFDPGDFAVLFLDSEPQIPQGWKILRHVPMEQMVCASSVSELETLAHSESEIETLSSKEISEILELTALTEPGPFRQRTFELGGFLGIREAGRLAAITGQRLALPGYTEVSAVCTHPDFRGRGYARTLVAAVSQNIGLRGEIPFLEVLQSNTSAIRVYESVGFAIRRTLHLAVVVPRPLES
jgi:predicted GNAT family acetyltransferase